jgi:hypothetical protein
LIAVNEESLMSQPPGPYGGQPPGYGQQPGPGQQPSSYPQQGSYPPPGGHPQHPGGYGQQGPYGPPPSYGQPPGPHDGGKRKSSLPWLLGGAGVLVIGGVVALILVLTSGADTSSPQGVAEAAVKAANAKDVDAIVDLSCQELKDKKDKIREDIDPAADPNTPDEFKNVTFTFTLDKVEQQGDDKATANVKVAFQNLPAEMKDLMPTTVKLNLTKESDQWRYCGIRTG